MPHSEQEIEAKFLIYDLDSMATRLQELGAQLTSQRVLETNLRFDTPDNAITRARHPDLILHPAGSALAVHGE